MNFPTPSSYCDYGKGRTDLRTKSISASRLTFLVFALSGICLQHANDQKFENYIHLHLLIKRLINQCKMNVLTDRKNEKAHFSDMKQNVINIIIIVSMSFETIGM